MEHLHDVQASVKANKIGEGEGSHGHIGSELHSGIDILLGGHSMLKGVDSLVDIRHEKTVGNEPGNVVRLCGGLAHVSGELEGRVESVLRSTEARDDFNELHHGHGVHEVHTNDLFYRGRRGRGEKHEEKESTPNMHVETRRARNENNNEYY